jgi:maleylacetate reductase
MRVVNVMRCIHSFFNAAKNEIEQLGFARALVLRSPEQESTGGQVATALGTRAAGVLAEARMHVLSQVAERAAT